MGVRKLLYSIGLVVTVIATGYSQTDTLRVFQYNLLNYGDNVNPTSYKDTRLKTIIQYTNPDIFSANEIFRTPSLQDNIRTSVLGMGWANGSYTNTNNQVQTNMLYWRQDKLQLVSQTTISHLLRDILAFKFYYKGAAMSVTDTVFLTVIVAHLKASSDTNSAKLRKQEVETVTNYINALGKGGNYIFLGDFNIYENTEQAYQSLSNHSSPYARFYDPLNKVGTWHNNNVFADVHTQSTRSVNLSDGGVSGGMDDRFDFIMTSSHILNDSSGIQYIAGSYKTLGQDGLHFNKSINASPTNTSAPPNVIQALYEMSDHLPVYADFVVRPQNTNSIVLQEQDFYPLVKVVNPITNNISLLWESRLMNKDANIALFSIDGRIIYNKKHTIDNKKQTLQLGSNLPDGVYILKVQVGHHSVNYKLIKN